MNGIPPRRLSLLVPLGLLLAVALTTGARPGGRAALPGSEVTARGMGVNPTRTGVLDVLREMGARVELASERESGGEPRADVTVRPGDLRAVAIGGALVPRLIDELPVVMALATQPDLALIPGPPPYAPRDWTLHAVEVPDEFIGTVALWSTEPARS